MRRSTAISSKDIELYDMVSFRSPNTGAANRNANQFAKVTADKYLLVQDGDQSPIATATDIFQQCAEDIERTSGVEQPRRVRARLEGRYPLLTGLFGIAPDTDRSSPYKKACTKRSWRASSRMRADVGHRTSPPTVFNGNHAALLGTAMKLAGKLPHELTHDDIMGAWHYEGDTLANSISAAFATYKVDQFIWAHKRLETESGQLHRTYGRVPKQIPGHRGRPSARYSLPCGRGGRRRAVRLRLLRSRRLRAPYGQL